METKDLMLLMMIPLVLVSLVVYTGKSPSITGAQTTQITQAADNNILGTYSIMPSFRAKVDYNLQEEYENILTELNKIISACKNSPDIGQCLKNAKPAWNCAEPADEAAEILYEFIDKFSECLSLEEDNVVCRFTLDERAIMNRPTASFDIILTDEVQRTRIELRGNDVWKDYVNYGNLAYTSDYKTKDTVSNSTNPVKYVIEYQGRNPLTKNAVAIDKGVPVQLSKLFLFYKTGNELKFIEAGQEGNFRTGPPANNIIDVPRVNGFRFCAKTGKQVYAYDNFDKTVKLRDVVYRFAVKYQR